jgi:glucuronoarabinoxylan endo-1,4-beta-xylanase
MKKQISSPNHLLTILTIFAFAAGPGSGSISAQTNSVSVVIEETHQTMVGFGASLAYYENWLTAHPRKAEIYDAIFAELSLDILRVRNCFDYDSSMIGRVVEFAQAAESSLGKPISILSSSWGPPGYLKSNNDRRNGGTLKFTENGSQIEFDYAGFAHWWNRSLDEYNSHGIYPDYISIQNEPDWSADWETCLFRPSETINTTDTIAGYNKALDAVYDTLLQRERKPGILGPESSGIGFSSVEYYVDALDVFRLDGIAHHLYNGVNTSDPWASINFGKVGKYHPEIPHFQTEYDHWDWFSLAGYIYKSLHDENAVAYLYWDLIWDGSGLVSLDFPWNDSLWTDPQKGYTKTKEFYTFKQFSGFIHPGWQRTGTDLTMIDDKVLTFVSPDRDSASVVIVNRSTTDSLIVHLGIPGYSIDESSIYISSDTLDCIYMGALEDSLLKMPPYSITTVEMKISEGTSVIPAPNTLLTGKGIAFKSLYPNPFTTGATLEFSLDETKMIWMEILDIQGRTLRKQSLGSFPPGDHAIRLNRNGLSDGVYFYKLGNSSGEHKTGKFIMH